MKKNLLILSVLLFNTLYIAGQTTNLFSASNTQTMQKGKWESGLIQPLRIGISESSEIYASLISMPLIPNIGYKKNWINKDEFSFATMHSLAVPTPFLNFSSASGVGGLIPPEFDFPFILSVSNSVLFSKQIIGKHLFTFKGSFVFAIRSGDVNPLATIDLPVFYPRMANYYRGSDFRFEMNISGPFLKKNYYEEATRIFLLTRKNHHFFWENGGYIFTNTHKKCILKIGYILSYGSYPYGSQWQLWPAFDIIFGNALKNQN